MWEFQTWSLKTCGGISNRQKNMSKAWWNQRRIWIANKGKEVPRNTKNIYIPETNRDSGQLVIRLDSGPWNKYALQLDPNNVLWNSPKNNSGYPFQYAWEKKTQVYPWFLAIQDTECSAKQNQDAVDYGTKESNIMKVFMLQMKNITF